MSGTSLDGMDVIYAEVDDLRPGYRIVRKEHLFQSFPSSFQTMARKIAQENLMYEAGLYSIRWVKMAESMIRQLLKKHSIQLDDLYVIGIHGQTVLHKPKPISFLGEKLNCTIQLANLSYLAENLGITVVGNFRQRDMAVGGQGAPFMSHIHKLLFGNLFHGLSLHNLGGIGNATIIHHGEIISAFDTGPANLWIDTILRWHTNNKKHFDQDGNLARKNRKKTFIPFLF
jgi:anhydro-N-acetylmuramic acid kinase